MQTKRRVLTVVMDGVGERADNFGNAVALANTPNLDFLRANAVFTTLKAHGKNVGLPSDLDIGNSEVGHNTLGSGRIIKQGASLVDSAIKSKELFQSPHWLEMLERAKQGKTLHFIGLLSDGNVHSHESHLHSMLREACQCGAKKIRVHVLLDGRDVKPKSAEIYADKLIEVLDNLNKQNCDAQVASGGGRMNITMDRYEADWSMLERGWKVHVEGEGPIFPDLKTAIQEFRKDKDLIDQNIPGFVIGKDQEPNGKILDGDSVILFNFRGDRAIEITRAFEDKDLNTFKRNDIPNIYFAGMMQYDGDLNIPKNYLVSPPVIKHSFSEHLAKLGVTQFACSETQKYGHVTYFWNGNRSGYFDKKIEIYKEIPSDVISFDKKPEMKALEITEATINAVLQDHFSFGRINFANGDMVGHTGNFAASVKAVAFVDLMIGKLIKICQKTKTILIVTADHGNCDQMFEGEAINYPHWHWEQRASHEPYPLAKTSHTLSPVPFYIYDPCANKNDRKLQIKTQGTLANFANTALDLMGLETLDNYDSSLILKG